MNGSGEEGRVTEWKRRLFGGGRREFYRVRGVGYERAFPDRNIK